MAIGIIFLGISILLFFLTIFIFYKIGRPEKIRDFKDDINKPSVSIIIPARNEESNIENCLRSLEALNYPNYEIIVVDGNSEDNTIGIIKKFSKVKLLNEDPRPKGWIGKNWACYQGYQESKGEILLFTDADTFHSRDSLSKMVQSIQLTNGFISFLTTQIFKTFWEYVLVQIFLTIAIALNGIKGSEDLAIANGQYLMFTREFYEKVGTHKVVYNSITEDMDFAIISNKLGTRPHIFSEPNLISVRMYRNLSELWEGFSKNLASGMNELKFGSYVKISIINFYFNLWSIFALVLIILFPYLDSFNFYLIILLIFFDYVSSVIFLVVTEYFLTNKISWHNIAYPIFIFVFYILIISSLLKTRVLGKVTWKGIDYKI